MASNCSTYVASNCTNCSTPPPSASCKFSYIEFIGYFYVHTIICIVGFILNCINCVIFCRKKQFEGAAYRFMTVLSIFDALTLLFSLPQGLLRCDDRFFPSFMKCSSLHFTIFRRSASTFEVYFGLFFHNMTESISAWLTCFLSVERFLAIKYHYIVKAYFSPPNVHKMLATIIGIGVIFHIPMFFVLHMTKRFNCAQQRMTVRILLTSFGRTKIYDIYTWLRNVLVMFGPLLFLCIVNALLIHLVRRQSRLHSVKQNNSSAAVAARSDKRARAQRKLTILLVVIICLFLCGQIPLAFAYHNIFTALLPKSCQTSCCLVKPIFRMIAQNTSLLSYAVNFFVYVGLNRHFRKALSDMCCGGFKKMRNQRTDPPNGSYRSVPLTKMAINETRCIPMSTPATEENGYDKITKEKEIAETKLPNSGSLSPLDGELPDTNDSEMCLNADEERQMPDITAV